MLHIFLLLLLTCASLTQANSIIIPRSQSVNAARELVGWQRYINLADKDCETYGAFAFTAEYQQSFRGNRLLQCLLDGDITFTSNNNIGSCNNNNSCSSNCNTGVLRVQGHCVTNRDPNAWLADYFGLDSTFDSSVFFSPKIKSGIFDFNLYVGLDKWVPGAYFRIHAPIVWTQWRLNATEVVNNPGGNLTPTGLPALIIGVDGPTEVDNIRTSFLSAVDGTYTFGDLKTPLAFGVFCDNALSSTGCCNNSSFCSNNSCAGNITRLSDIEVALGYNLLLCEDYHFGLNIRGSVPTGNKPCGVCIFEPIVGNGKFGTLGFGLSAHSVLWRDCECPDRTFSFYLDANVTHLFTSCQNRSFDLKGKPNSRYMLIEQFSPAHPTTVTGANFPNGAPANLFSNLTGVTAAGSTALNLQYTGNLFYLINKSTFKAKVSYAGQADVALKFSYMTPNLDIDLGYEFWGRSREKICLPRGAFPEETYALKGDARIYGFTADDSTTLGANSGNPVALSATESLATIHNGTNFPNSQFCNQLPFVNNSLVDNPQFAMFGLNGNAPAANNDQLIRAPGFGAGATRQIQTSNQPVFIRASDLDLEGCNSISTNKFFANISYSWDCECWSPFFGIGGEVEFGSCTSGDSCSTSNVGCCSAASSCCTVNNCSISQWGIWLKTGVGF